MTIAVLRAIRDSHLAAAQALDGAIRELELKETGVAKPAERTTEREPALPTAADGPPKRALLSPKEAAARLGVTAHRLAEMRLLGGPRFVHSGKSIRYPAHDLDAWLEGLRQLFGTRETDGTPSPTVARALSPVPASTEPVVSTGLANALAAARIRGEAVKKELLADLSMLTTAGMARLLGMSESGVRRRRKRHEILGLEVGKRCVRYPGWQVTEDRKLLPALQRLFEILGDDPWRALRFLRQGHRELGGRFGVEALMQGDVEGALSVAKSMAAGAFS